MNMRLSIGLACAVAGIATGAIAISYPEPATLTGPTISPVTLREMELLGAISDYAERGVLGDEDAETVGKLIEGWNQLCDERGAPMPASMSLEKSYDGWIVVSRRVPAL